MKGGLLNTNRLGYIIIAFVLLIEIPRFAGAYAAIDTTWLPSVGTGIVLPIGAGFVFHAWWKTNAEKKGRNVLLFWFGTLMVLEPIILVPWGVAQLRNVPLASVVIPGFWEVAWITVVMMSPFIMTAAVVNGLALQKTKVASGQKEQHIATSNDIPIQVKPTTWQEFKAQYPDMLQMTGKEIQEKVGISICEKTANNWKQYARNGNGSS